ncbi:zinc-binding alcohol dehydrogenase family protein [Streptomyces sp. NPDC059866]|uniref:quinone oxidoreductase family protein n=1 Tax=Streptomyces sp. NPDC059866 TaxID=3346978 RepID=UPI00364BA999
MVVVVNDERLLELPDSLDWAEGSALTVNYLTTYLSLTRVVQVQPGQSALVCGVTGGVGHAVVQTSKALGARPIAVVSSAHKARRAIGAGATAAIDLPSQDIDKAVGLTDGQGVDLDLDPVGGARFGELLRNARRHGMLVSLGFTGGRQPVLDLMDLIAADRHIAGHGLHADSDENVTPALKEVGKPAAGGRLRPVIDSRFALDDFEDGYTRPASREAIGSIVVEL